MKKQEILKGNKIIAEFMKLHGSFDPADGYTFGTWYKQNTDNSSTPSPILYHSSWEWLMPVVEHIENIELENGSFGVEIINCECEIHHFGSLSVCYEEGETKIEATYKAVIEFIKWYTKNNKLNISKVIQKKDTQYSQYQPSIFIYLLWMN